MPVWKAFNDLHRARSVGWGAEPLAVSDIAAYLDTYGIEGEERLEWFEMVSFLDAVWLDWARSKQEKQRKAEKQRRKKGRD